ncbi:hypothetical protein D3Z36_17315, partial [Lachnospiraceae bacterium]|nr:hypothetical protein [Lachnospiraceae bacterium]
MGEQWDVWTAWAEEAVKPVFDALGKWPEPLRYRFCIWCRHIRKNAGYILKKPAEHSLLWSSIFVTLVAKKYQFSVMMLSVP